MTFKVGQLITPIPNDPKRPKGWNLSVADGVIYRILDITPDNRLIIQACGTVPDMFVANDAREEVRSPSRWVRGAEWFTPYPSIIQGKAKNKFSIPVDGAL